MAVMDEFREEREALKNADFKTKFCYFLDYYKWHVVVVACVIGFVVSYIHGIVTAKDYALNGSFLNSYTVDELYNEFVSEYVEYAQIDLDEYNVQIDTTMQINPETPDENTIAYMQKLTVLLAAGELDFLAGGEDIFYQYANPDTLYDLSQVYTADELAALEGYIYYIDMDVIREREAIMENPDAVYTYVAPVYDHFAPEEMGDPLPVGICIQDSPKIKDHFYFSTENVPFGIVVNTTRLDAAKAFLDYLTEDMIAQ